GRRRVGCGGVLPRPIRLVLQAVRDVVCERSVVRGKRRAVAQTVPHLEEIVHGGRELDGDLVVLAQLGEHLVGTKLVGSQCAQTHLQGGGGKVTEEATERHL